MPDLKSIEPLSPPPDAPDSEAGSPNPARTPNVPGNQPGIAVDPIGPLAADEQLDQPGLKEDSPSEDLDHLRR
jgi:hypothetical protein